MRQRRRRRCRRWRAPRNGRSRRILLRRARSGPGARGGGTPSASSRSSAPLLDSHSCTHTYRFMLRGSTRWGRLYTRTSQVKRLSSTETPRCLTLLYFPVPIKLDTEPKLQPAAGKCGAGERRTCHQQGGNSWIIPTGQLNCSQSRRRCRDECFVLISHIFCARLRCWTQKPIGWRVIRTWRWVLLVV